MSRQRSFTDTGHAINTLLTITYLLCIGFDILFLNHGMKQALSELLPGLRGEDFY